MGLIDYFHGAAVGGLAALGLITSLWIVNSAISYLVSR